MTKFISRFAKDESGATAIEYGLIAALIAVVIITVLGWVVYQMALGLERLCQPLHIKNS